MSETLNDKNSNIKFEKQDVETPSEQPKKPLDIEELARKLGIHEDPEELSRQMAELSKLTRPDFSPDDEK
jgi:hypothetical protein